MKTPTRRLQQSGFTIIELMVATAVLSLLLLLVTAMMLNIGNLFYKGVNQAKVQDAVRNITADVAQHLQLSDGPPQASPPANTPQPSPPAPPIQTDITIPANANDPNHFNGYTISAYCIGTTRYSYVKYMQTSANPAFYQIHHGLWRDTLTSGAACSPVDLQQSNPTGSGPDGTELLPYNSRLTAFDINTNASPYTITVGVAYGDWDLLNLGAPAGLGVNTTCKGNVADQFCATASLQTTVTRRL